MKIRILSIYALLVAGCGGGGSTDPLVNTGVQGVDDIGCTQEFYQTMIGSYSGSVVFNEGQTSPRICEWQSLFVVAGQSIGPRCLLRTETSAAVIQSTFYDDDPVLRYQCLDDSGERTIREPIGPSFPPLVFPNLDNSQYPVEIEVTKHNLIDSGPYFDDETIITRYVNIFDGSQSDLVEQIVVEGDGSISLRTRAGALLGTLIKEQ